MFFYLNYALQTYSYTVNLPGLNNANAFKHVYSVWSRFVFLQIKSCKKPLIAGKADEHCSCVDFFHVASSIFNRNCSECTQVTFNVRSGSIFIIRHLIFWMFLSANNSFSAAGSFTSMGSSQPTNTITNTQIIFFIRIFKRGYKFWATGFEF